MANGTFQIVGLQTGLPNQGQSSLGPFNIAFSAVEYDIVLSLPAGNNQVSLPTGLNGFFLIPPVANTNSITLKGTSSDTGLFGLSPNSPTFINYSGGSAPNSIFITIGTATTLIGLRAV